MPISDTLVPSNSSFRLPDKTRQVYSNPRMSLKVGEAGQFVGVLLFSLIRESARWESGNPAFGFPLSHGVHRRGFGNVKIALGDFQGPWETTANSVALSIAIETSQRICAASLQGTTLG